MNKRKEILIVGAGPAGLSMAIFLCDLGYEPRIIDKKTEISEYSKALAVNPTTLDIFEPLGITDRFLSNGRRMTAVNIWKEDKHVYKNRFEGSHSKYPFMLIQPQKESEEILLEELSKRGIDVVYGAELSEVDTLQSTAIVKRELVEESIIFDYIVGADGGNSMVRQLYNIEYEGFKYDEEWELYDVELNMPIEKDEGHIRVFPEGGMIMIRLKDDIWRIAGSLESILDYLPVDTTIGNITWKSNFRIHHKLANELTKQNMALIGDAAHLHSPVGARGMNLGIQDAFIAAKLLHNNGLGDYNALRRPYLKKTVGQINNLTMGLAGDSFWSNIARQRLESMSFLFPFIMPRARKFIMGLS